MNSSLQTGLNRRRFLRGAAAMIALPSLEAFGAAAPAVVGPRNFVAVGSYLGLHQNAFYPKATGKNYEMPDTLKPVPHAACLDARDLKDQHIGDFMPYNRTAQETIGRATPASSSN